LGLGRLGERVMHDLRDRSSLLRALYFARDAGARILREREKLNAGLIERV